MRIFLDVEGAQRVVRQMRTTAQQHEAKVRQMQRYLQQMLLAWQGDSPRQYVEEQQGHLQRILRYVQTLFELADELEREITEYRRVDRSGPF